MATLKLLLRKNKQKKDGTLPVAIRITKNRQSAYQHTGISVADKDWDADNAKVRRGHPNSQRINNHLQAELSRLTNICLGVEAQNLGCGIREIKDAIEGKAPVAKDEAPKFRFKEMMESRIADSRADGKHKRARLEEYTLGKILKFAKGKNPRFEDIDVNFLKSYERWCKNTRSNSTNTVRDNMITIRTVYNLALEAGHAEPQHYPFVGQQKKKGRYAIKKEETKKVGLDKKEVKMVEGVDCRGDNPLLHAKNIWLFSLYFAGVRASDMITMKWGDIVGNRLHYRMGKNSKLVNLKIQGKAADILWHYRQREKNGDYVFPFMDGVAHKPGTIGFTDAIESRTASINRQLKKLAGMAGLDKKLTMHIARHTFGNISSDKIPVQKLQVLYRHSNIDTTINYQKNFINQPTDDSLAKVLDF